MSDFTNDISENAAFRKKGLLLSQEFALLEGRRPRILVGGAAETLAGSMNKICITLADMGFDVDVAPKLKTLKKLVTQSLENDADILMIYSNNCISSEELLEVQHDVLDNQPYLVLSLFMRDPNCISMLKKYANEWTIFDEMENEYFMGYHLLGKLLSR